LTTTNATLTTTNATLTTTTATLTTTTATLTTTTATLNTVYQPHMHTVSQRYGIHKETSMSQKVLVEQHRAALPWQHVVTVGLAVPRDSKQKLGGGGGRRGGGGVCMLLRPVL
ncbi:hypothetical protein FHG87_025341, partial [Trinorchestia longiramus]